MRVKYWELGILSFGILCAERNMKLAIVSALIAASIEGTYNLVLWYRENHPKTIVREYHVFDLIKGTETMEVYETEVH